MNIDPRNFQSDRLVFYPTVEVVAAMALTPKFHRSVARKACANSIATQDRGTDLERLAEFGGRQCYDSYGKGRSSAEYHGHIVESGHGSVLEHAFLTFELEGVSRGLTHELVRHRVGVAISQRSTRYVDESGGALVVPPIFVVDVGDTDEVANDKRASQLVLLNTHEAAVRAYNVLVRDAERSGRDRKTARGAARSSLGNGLETSMVWTCNLRALLNVLRQRGSPFADREIRRLAIELYHQALPHAPAILAECVTQYTADDGHYALKVKSP